MCVCVLWRTLCWHRNCLQEAAVPGGAPLADALCSLPVCCKAGRHTHTHLHTHTPAQGCGGAGCSPGERSNKMRVREEGTEGRREGGRREFSREQHFPTVWGFDTWLSHIPQPCGRPSISTQRKEGEREEGSTLARLQTIWSYGRQGVCVCVCMCPLCVSFNLHWTPCTSG